MPNYIERPKEMGWQATRKIVYERDKGRCFYCGEPVSKRKYEVHHKVPRSLGGTDNLENLVVSHPGCNKKDFRDLTLLWGAKRQ